MKTIHTALGWVSESFQQSASFTAFLKSPESRMVPALSLLAILVAFIHLPTWQSDILPMLDHPRNSPGKPNT